MNKMTKKLFSYFAAILIFLSLTAFFGFVLVLRYYSFRQREIDLQARAETIQEQLEQFMQMSGPKQGKGAYLKFIDDIAMADAYIIDTAGNPFSYGKNAIAKNLPSEEVKEFAARVFASGTYEHSRKNDKEGNPIFYAGVPVRANGQIVAAMVIHDNVSIDQYGFLLAVTVLGICMTSALVLSLLLAIVLSKRFISPIRQIALTIKELTLGNYQVKMKVYDKTELGELAKETDILAHKLDAARAESQKMEQMQKDYISNISHELRTPVTVIRSSLEAICDGTVRGEKIEEYQMQMLEESIALQRLVNDMLELSRLQNKDFPIEKEEMDLLLTLEDAKRAVRVLAHNKKINIFYEKDVEECLIEGDYGRLRQMFIAVLDNAIKYSEFGKTVNVKAAKQECGIVISIKDYGCGIPKDELDNIFTKFYRAGQRREKGSGLGLSIIKNIAERHDIQITIESVWQEGTTVRFTIPDTIIVHFD